MGNMSLHTVKLAIEAVSTKNLPGSQEVFLLEEKVDAEEVEIERQAINLLALHQPAGGDLRTIFAIVKINSDLERIADCGVNIAQQTAPLFSSGLELPRDLRRMAEAMLKQFEDTLQCLAHKDIALAQQISRADDLLDALYNQLLQELQRDMAATPAQVPGYLALIMVARNIERIGDHCTNIAEDVLYRMQGRIVRHTHDPR